MSSGLNAFDPVASYYDSLARLIFGRSIRTSQTAFFTSIPRGAAVLVVGGGTGRWMPELLQIPGVRVDYVEASGKMLGKARSHVSDDRVNYIHGTEENIPGRVFDVIITPFVLDVFDERQLDTFANTILKHLKPKGQWFVTDFLRLTAWHAVMLKSMYLFFRVTCKLQNNRLPPWKVVLERNGLKCSAEQLFFGRFISSAVFTRSE